MSLTGDTLLHCLWHHKILSLEIEEWFSILKLDESPSLSTKQRENSLKDEKIFCNFVQILCKFHEDFVKIL